MTLQEFGEALKALEVPVHHFEASEETAEHYLVWQETGGRAHYGSNRRQVWIRTSQVTLCTAIEFDPLLDQLLTLLENHGVAFRELTTAYDAVTKLTRHTVTCEMLA